MKITDVKVFEVIGVAHEGWRPREARTSAPLDVYPEFQRVEPPPAPNDGARGRTPLRAVYVEVVTDVNMVGLYGPIMREQAFIIRSKLRPFLIGRDPMCGETLWDQMRRLDRHGRTGHMMMAISAVDCALWDFRGKRHGVPVYQLLGGPTRERVRAYASMGGDSLEPDRASDRARQVYDRGFTAQKWFFRNGPGDGEEGRRENLRLVRALREALGEDAQLMFDGGRSWDVAYAIQTARDMAPYEPTWLEEPFQPERLEAYLRLKQETDVPLAAGEHLYTRWDVKPFLDAGVLDYLQADPDWTGGITEMQKICALADLYDVKVVPHGHHILAALHVVAAQAPGLCPMVEYLFRHLDRSQYFHKNRLRPEGGWLSLPTEPGLGLAFDKDRVEDLRELKWE